MKKLVMVAVLSLLCAVEVQATTWVRCRFRAIGATCWAGGTVNDQGLLIPIVNNPAYTYTVITDYADGQTYVGQLTVDIRPDMCSSSSPQVGYYWKESTTNGGASWSLVSGSFTYVYMGAATAENIWTCTAGGPLTVWHTTACPF